MMNQLKTVLLLGMLSALVVAIGNAFAPGALAFFVAVALAMNVGAYFFSDRLVLRLHRARPVERSEAPWLHATVEELSARAGIPAPRLFLIPEEQPNAFATGRDPKHGVVAVTEGILHVLDRRELRGVLAHEIAHIKNRDILLSSIAAVLGSVVTTAANVLSFGAMFGGGGQNGEEGGSPAGGLLLAVTAPIAATLVQLGISRSREYLADETGARISGDPEALASALLKLERSAERIPADIQPATASLFITNPLRDGGMNRLFSTHPAVAERVRRLLAMAADGLPVRAA